jgi:hypothetical protein
VDPAPSPGPFLPAARWGGSQELRADLPAALRVVAVLAVLGGPAGLLWWALAPRADYRVTESGPEVIGAPPAELKIADDAVLALVLAAIGLAAGLTVWFLRRRRGVATVLALAAGTVLTGVAAWQVGELLGEGPTEAQLEQVGATVTTPLTLGSVAALAVGPFVAVLSYVLLVIAAPGDDLGRPAPSAPPGEFAPPPEAVRLGLS